MKCPCGAARPPGDPTNAEHQNPSWGMQPLVRGWVRGCPHAVPTRGEAGAQPCPSSVIRHTVLSPVPSRLAMLLAPGGA